jgi:hypothetical protein
MAGLALALALSVSACVAGEVGDENEAENAQSPGASAQTAEAAEGQAKLPKTVEPAAEEDEAKAVELAVEEEEDQAETAAPAAGKDQARDRAKAASSAPPPRIPQEDPGRPHFPGTPRGVVHTDVLEPPPNPW